MLDYLYQSALRYQELHGQVPNLLYLNNIHLNSLQSQLNSHHSLARLFGEWNLKVAISPSLPHPSFACI